jgi:hypothetical protein
LEISIDPFPEEGVGFLYMGIQKDGLIFVPLMRMRGRTGEGCGGEIGTHPERIYTR